MDETNPYGEAPGAPVAGRQSALMRLDQYLKDPGTSAALLLLGKRWQGKTALLHHTTTFFENAAISVYLPGKSLPMENERDFTEALIAATTRAITARDISLTRLPEADHLPQDLRKWLHETWLPGVLHVIRANRHLLLLFDDVEFYLRALDNGNILADHPAYLAQLLREHPQFKMVLSLPTEAEADLDLLSPLVTAAQSIRLSNLRLDETTALLQEPVAGQYALTPEAIQSVQQATGGQPRFVQCMAAQIYEYSLANSPIGRITPEIIKGLTPTVYRASEDELESFWHASTENEQVLLLSLSSLHLEDPLRPLDPAALADWLIDSEFPLDQTAINAALRSLEYRELILRRPSGIILSSELFETWLLNHARHSINRADPAAAARWPVIAIVLVAALALLALLLIVNLSNVPQATNSGTIQPTVTLAEGE